MSDDNTPKEEINEDNTVAVPGSSLSNRLAAKYGPGSMDEPLTDLEFSKTLANIERDARGGLTEEELAEKVEEVKEKAEQIHTMLMSAVVAGIVFVNLREIVKIAKDLRA